MQKLRALLNDNPVKITLWQALLLASLYIFAIVGANLGADGVGYKRGYEEARVAYTEWNLKQDNRLYWPTFPLEDAEGNMDLGETEGAIIGLIEKFPTALIEEVWCVINKEIGWLICGSLMELTKDAGDNFIYPGKVFTDGRYKQD